MIDKGLQQVYAYFAQFQYEPTIEQVYLFYPRKISMRRLKSLLRTKQKSRYYATTGRRRNEALKKQEYIKRYVSILSHIPSILLVALSGSVAVGVAKRTDDIDLFIITKANRLWTARIIATSVTFAMGLKRPRLTTRAANKVCLNLWFDERDVRVPVDKQNVYVAHEVLQAVPLINKAKTYERFLRANAWVAKFFPNAPIPTRTKRLKKTNTWIGNSIEWIAKQLQLAIMHSHRTTERITDTQLWFFPRDMETRIRS